MLKIQNISLMVIFSIGLIVLSTGVVYAETSPVDVDGVSFDVNYIGTGVTVSSIVADSDFVSLNFNVLVPEVPGTLQVTVERAFLDSRDLSTNTDIPFIVTIDGETGTFTEVTSAENRILDITLPAGSILVEIVGSQFGLVTIETPMTEAPIAMEDTELPPIVMESTELPPIEMMQKPVTMCGDGTILKDNVCTLSEMCGEGTTLVDGQCVADPTVATEAPVKGLGIQLITSLIIGFVIAGIVGVVLAVISKASKK
ncbi:MAG: hypothetical protein SCG72_03760 [Nitrosarchaeum sp.]|nr:hypothetical protein [Nitrosarchaeum sp.]